MKIIFIAAFMMISWATFGQAVPDSLTIDDLYIDFTAPEITAFSILDLEIEEVVTPGSTKEFLTSVLNYVDDSGNAKPGLAIEWAPAHTLIKNIPQTGFGRSIRNVSFSLATASSDTTSSQLGLGLKWTIYDKTNPYNDRSFRQDLHNIFKSIDDSFGSKLKIVTPEIFSDKHNLVLLILERLNNDDTQFGEEDAFNLVDKVFKFNNTHFTQVLKKFEDNGIPLNYKTISNDRISSLRSKLLNKVKPKGNQSDSVINIIVNRFLSNNDVSSTISNLVENFIFATSFISPQKLYAKRLEILKKDYETENWNKTAIQLTGGYGWHSDSSFVGDYKQMVKSFALTAGFPFDIFIWNKLAKINALTSVARFFRKKSRWIFQFKYQNYDNAKFELNDQISLGSRFIFGANKVRVSYEFARLWEDNSNTNPAIDSDGWRHTVGVQYKISEDFWTEVAFAGRTEDSTSDLEMLPRFTFRRSFRTDKRF